MGTLLCAQGFTWLEEKWHVDLSGQSAAAVDADGWTYAVDFPWLSMPPNPGSGRMCAPPDPLAPTEEAHCLVEAPQHLTASEC